MRHLTPQEAQALARELMDKHGLADWQFRFDNCKRRIGVCSHSRKLIGLSREFLPIIDESEIRDTLLHEIAHAKTSRMFASHGPEWRVMAASLGARPRACKNVAAPAPTFTATCEKCGKKFNRYRLKRHRIYWCPCTRTGPPPQSRYEALLQAQTRPQLKWVRNDRSEPPSDSVRDFFTVDETA